MAARGCRPHDSSTETRQVTGPVRNLAQDPAFGIDQLVEIALRALSPAVNDTYTALTCVDWLAKTLCKLAKVWKPAQAYRDRIERER